MRLDNRSPFKGRTKYGIEDKADEATVYLYDEVGWLGVQAETFVKDLNAIKAPVINLRVNSPGGSVFDGTSIYNALRQHKARVIAHIDGLAASISSLIVMAANEIRMADNAYLMIHEPWSMIAGNAAALRAEAELLEKVGGTISKAYVSRSGQTEEKILELMNAETWMTAEEALELGFIDTIYDEKPEKAEALLFDLSIFSNAPDELKGEAESPLTARDAERVLRDAGFSRAQAKAILADGFEAALQRDADVPPADPQALDGDQRDAEPEEPTKRDRTADLLIRGQMIVAR